MKEKNAFTLAEVLITLGIIGVVAAMTLPILVNKYQKKIWETSFAKSVNTIINGNKKLFADEEQFSLCDLKDLECYNPENVNGILIRDGHMDSYMKKLGLDKKKVDLGMNDLFGEDYYVSKDGMCFYPYNITSNSASFGSDISFEMFVDTNCAKNPNQGGRDRFFIIMNEKLKLLNAEVGEQVCKSTIKEPQSNQPAIMLYCGLYLVENSYNMDY